MLMREKPSEFMASSNSPLVRKQKFFECASAPTEETRLSPVAPASLAFLASAKAQSKSTILKAMRPMEEQYLNTL